MVLNGSVETFPRECQWVSCRDNQHQRKGRLCPIKISWGRLSVSLSRQILHQAEPVCLILFITTTYEIKLVNLENKPKRLC